jgi:hypothetical protein
MPEKLEINIKDNLPPSSFASFLLQSPAQTHIQ